MKKFKAKKAIKKKKLIIILIVLFYIINTNFDIKFKNSKKNIIEYVFKNDIKYTYKNNIFNNLYNTINKNIFNNPVNILHTNINNSDTIVVSNISYVENTPKIYIYNSHQGERYSDKYLENSNIVPDIMLASTMLKEKLENLGINTIVEKNDILKYMYENNLNHGGSYIASRYYLNKIYDKYPNLDLYIDMHRDAVNYDIVHTNINGKECARVLFVIGLENPNYEKNLEVTTKLNNIILNKYPSLTRGILKKQGADVNGIYNQDLNKNVILIEIGGDKNNIDEVNNTLDLIADVIKEYIYEKEKI